MPGRPPLSTPISHQSLASQGIGNSEDVPVWSGDQGSGEPGFNEYMLGGVIGLTLFAILLVISLYLLPGEHLQLSELQPAIRVGDEKAFPVGASRVVTWGEDAILVVRSGSAEYHALQGTSSLDGCILEWDPASLRVVSPCNFLVYDLRGNVVRGLTTVPLRRYTIFVRQGTVYVTGR